MICTPGFSAQGAGMCSSGDVLDYVLLYSHVHFLVFVLPRELLNKIYALKT